MNDHDFIAELRIVLNAQRSILADADRIVVRLEQKVSEFAKTKDQLAELRGIMTDIEDGAGLLEANDFKGWEKDEAILKCLYEQRRDRFETNISDLKFTNWQQFVRNSEIYHMKEGTEGLLPWEAMLSEAAFAQLREESYDQKYRWDKWDYAFVGAAGVLASLTDYLLVRIPEAMTYAGVEQAGSPITAFIKKIVNSEEGSNTWFSNYAHELEEYCKVPYDIVANSDFEGLCGRTHRLQTLGHDPALGMVFGVIDILRGSVSGFSYDSLSGKHTLKFASVNQQTSISLIEAILLQLGHLVSDVGTKMGIPPPFFSLLQGINLISPFSPKDRRIGEIARWMYLNGYDLRHFITMGITPAVIEIVIRGYLMLRHYSENKEVKFTLGNNPKYRSMLLTGHAIACAGNAGKIALMQGNPLAINYAEWLALVRYLIPSLKYWLFDKSKLEIEHVERINQAGWQELCKAADNLIERVYKDSCSGIQLGGT